jgi:hypothetical protein
VVVTGSMEVATEARAQKLTSMVMGGYEAASAVASEGLGDGDGGACGDESEGGRSGGNGGASGNVGMLGGSCLGGGEGNNEVGRARSRGG